MPKLRSLVLVSAVYLVVALVSGCGGGGTGSSPSSSPGPAQISVAIGTPASTSMIGGATQTFTASVVNDSSNAGVTWAATVGTITASGVYTAPAPVKVAQATITATSKSDLNKSASAIITLMPIIVTIGPSNPAIMGSGATQVLTATVAHDGLNGGVTWTVSGGGSFSAGSSSNGVSTVTYTAPSPVSTFTVTVNATSVTDPSTTQAVTISLAQISVNPISPVSASLGTGGSQVFTDSVANDPSNSGVSWSITSGPGMLSAVSSTSVRYNAPTTVINAATPVTLTATSIKDPTKSTTANITLNRISVTIAPTNPLVMLGGAAQAFTAAVANDGSNAGVTWTVTGGGGSFSPSSTLSGVATTYTAVSPVSAASATLTATSITDSTKSASVNVVLTPITISLTSASAIALDGNGLQTLAVSASITGDASGSGATFVVTGAGGTMIASPVSGNSPSAIYTAPVVSAQTTATITVASVKDPTKNQMVTVTLNPPMSFTTPPGALTVASAGGAYGGATIVVAGGTGNRTFTLASGALPAGLALSSTGAITGTVTGALGTSNFTVQVVDQAPTPTTISGSFSIAVGTGPPVWVSPTAGTQIYTVGTAIPPITLSTSGGTGSVTYTVNSGALPQGLQIVGNQITGKPTAPTALAGNAVTFLATDSATPAATTLSASVIFIANPVALAINSTTLPGATAGTPYSYQLTSTGGTGTITWTLTGGSWTDTGLAMSGTGMISGMPTAARNPLSLTFQAQDSATDQQQTKTVTLALSFAGPLVVTTASGSLPTSPIGFSYGQTLAAAGGTESGYTWTVTSVVTGPNSLASLHLSLSGAGVITGTPTTAGTANFTAQVTDSLGHTASGSFSVSTAPALTLPVPNPTSLGAGTITIPYAGAITALGGIPGYVWTVNGSAVPANATAVVLADNLTVTNTGGATLSVSGTPSSIGTVSFTAAVTDSTGTTSGTFTYTIAVGNFFTVGGQINSQVGCITSGLTDVTVTINTNPIQTTKTSANGSFSFINVPNGTYIITPSISGSSSAFYPATQTVVVNSDNLSAASFTATLGYTVSGTVAYTGTQQGRIYLALNPTGNCGGRSPGTSLSSTGAYSIRGVPPGNYTLQAFMDTVGDGVPNAANPKGSTPGVNPTTANISGVDVTLGDPAAVMLTLAPTLTSVSPFNTGVFVQYKPITNSVGLEMATYYSLQWSLSPSFATIDGSKRFPANGTHSNVWFLRGLTNGSEYYFRAYGTSGGTLAGPFSQIIGPKLITAPTVGNVVTGSVNFITASNGPLYVGYLDQGSGAFYGQYFVSPISAQAFNIQVPNGSDYLLLGVLDQDNDGAIGASDITNTGNGSSTPVISILGATSNQSLTLPNTDGIASVTTQNLVSVTPGGASTQNYNINFTVNGLVKRPVAVSLVSGQNLITPVDIAICGGSGSTCGQGFQISFNLYGTRPTVGDDYIFDVTYSDGTKESTGSLHAAVTAVLDGFAVNLAPQTGTSASTTPTFTWTDPLSAASYTYQFYMTDSSANVIWQIPRTNAASNGFSSAITNIPWGVDPSGGGSLPAVSSLTSGTAYSWQITVQDGNGNSTATHVPYQP